MSSEIKASKTSSDKKLTVYLLPGFDGTGELFDPLKAFLDHSFNTVAVRYENEVLFEDYVETLDRLLPIDRVNIIAESFSGPVALALIARNPQRFRRVVLCATFAVSPFRWLTRIARFLPTQMYGPKPAHRLVLQTFCLDHNTDSDLLTKTVKVIHSVPAATIKARFAVLADLDLRPMLARISTPILHLQATHDRIVSPSLSRQLVRGLPNVITHKIQGPHLLLQSRPEACAGVIQPYLASE